MAHLERSAEKIRHMWLKEKFLDLVFPPARMPNCDFRSPEGAVLMLEEACRRNDLEAVVRAKDFRKEAELMLRRLHAGLPDEVTVASTAEVLESAFRLEMKSGMPDFSTIRSRFTRKVPYRGEERTVVLFESFDYPDGTSTVQRLLVAETQDGWRVLNVLE
jgi:hypothetical protein